MLTDIYQQMLDEFGDTLEHTSEDSDEKTNPKGRGVFMTSSKERVVNFDKFKNSVAAKNKFCQVMRYTYLAYPPPPLATCRRAAEIIVKAAYSRVCQPPFSDPKARTEIRLGYATA
jgi:hypothetical protein